MTTITTKTKAWIPGHSSIGPAELRDPKRIAELCFSDRDMEKVGWTYVGKAAITVELVDEHTLVANKVDALRNELKQVRAEAEMRATQIEGRINDLLCLEFSPEEES